MLSGDRHLVAWVGGMALLCVSLMTGCAKGDDSPAGPPSQPDKLPQSKAGGSPATERTGEDWPEFLGPRQTGVSGETGLLAKWPKEGPPVVWKRRIGTGYSAPSVRGNKLILHHRPAGEEVIECFEADTGKPIWHHRYVSEFVDPYGYNNGPRCTPLLTEDRCYTFGAEGKLICLELENGNKVWENTEKFDVAPAFFGVGATPILEGNLLIVMMGAHPKAGMVAFDAKTGKVVWKSVGPESFPEPNIRYQRDRKPQKLASYSTPICATIHGQRHLFCLMRPGLVSLNPQTGEERFAYWFRSPLHDSVNAARPVVVGDQVFLSAAYDVGAALLRVNKDGKGFEEAWRDEEIMANHWSTSIYKDGYVYGFSGRHKAGSKFRCVELQKPKLAWEVKTPETAEEHAALPQNADEVANEAFGRGSLIEADGKFILLGEGGVLALAEINPRKYVEISRVHFPEMTDPSWAAPVLSRKRLYLRSEHHLLCLDLAGGK